MRALASVPVGTLAYEKLDWLVRQPVSVGLGVAAADHFINMRFHTTPEEVSLTSFIITNEITLSDIQLPISREWRLVNGTIICGPVP